jgi:succinoglycan biosynthesis transport protein ExoP
MSNLTRDPSEAPTEATVDIREFMAIVGRRKWLVAAVTLLVVGLAGLYSYMRAPVYTAEADVLVRPILVSPLDPNQIDQISMETESQLVTSAPVAAAAKGLMKTSLRVPELLKHTSVTVPENTQILEIAFSDPDPATARLGAQAFADAYLEFKSQQAIDSVTQHIETLRERINEYEREITDVNRELASTPRSSAEWKTLSDTGNALEASRLALQNQLASISTVNEDPGMVIRPAQQPVSPSSPNHQLDLGLGLVLGLFVGMGIASATERVRDRVRSPAVLEGSLEAPTLGVIPRTSALRGRSSRLVTVEEPRGPAAEAYRTLRTNLLAVCRQTKAKTLLVTSAGMSEGKSTVAANLAAALAQAGRSVVLISADLRYPRLHAFFGISNEQGLGQVLSGTVPLAEALSDTPIDGLRVLPSGSGAGIKEPVELLQSDRMREVIKRSSERDFVVIDSPPILAVADSVVLAGLVDGVLLVANARKATRASVVQSRQQLGQVEARVLGAVLNGVEGWRTPTVHSTYYYRPTFLNRRRFPWVGDDRAARDGQTGWSSDTEPDAARSEAGHSSIGSSNGATDRLIVVQKAWSPKSNQPEGPSPRVRVQEVSAPTGYELVVPPAGSVHRGSGGRRRRRRRRG